MSTQIESIDFKALKLEGGPVTYNKQIGYGNFFLNVTVFVFGDSYDQTKTTFSNSAGQFSYTPFLNPQDTTETNQVTSSGLMTLTVNSIQFAPATPDTAASITLNAVWTDLNGSGKKSFVGTIAQWTNPPSGK